MVFCRGVGQSMGSVCVLCIVLRYLAPDRESARSSSVRVVVYKLARGPFASAKSLAWSGAVLYWLPPCTRLLPLSMMYRGLRVWGCFCIHPPPFFFSLSQSTRSRRSPVEHAYKADSQADRSTPPTESPRHRTPLCNDQEARYPPLHSLVTVHNMSKRTSSSVKAESTAPVVSAMPPMSEEKRKALQQYKDDDGHFSLVR